MALPALPKLSTLIYLDYKAVVPSGKKKSGAAEHRICPFGWAAPTEIPLPRSLVTGLLKWFAGVAPALKVRVKWSLFTCPRPRPPHLSRELLLLASTSRRHENLIHNHDHTHSGPLWRCHTSGLSLVSVLQAVQPSICCCLSASAPSLPSLPLPLCPIQSQLPAFIRSPPADQSQPCFLIQHGHAPAPPATTVPVLTVQFAPEAHGKYTAKNSRSDEPFNLEANFYKRVTWLEIRWKTGLD